MYGYAYKFIVEFYGRFLNNSCFYPCSSSFVETDIDPLLAEVGLEARVLGLSFGDALIKFPRPDDFPGFGYWSAEQVGRDASKAASIVADNEHVTAVLGWIREASRKGRAIVGFYH
jgi:hypothetical protein